ncbi:MAG: hypothetical protein MN733_20850, partial [Nitrososphaera sp.]|nr:hypothetical protein [Nitrososphaera sp.]
MRSYEDMLRLECYHASEFSKRLVMKHRGRKNPPQLVLGEDGEPSAVILDIEEYRELLERLEDAEDL